MRTSLARAFAGAFLALAGLTLAAPRLLTAQATLEGSKWRIDQEGVDTQVLWWLGSEGRVRTGDLGIILPAYKWRQSGDSVFVSIGDTVRYAAMLMSNRLVGGIRSWRNRGEGWWSGERADVAAPTAVAAAPAAAPPGAQPMSRPADSAATPSAPAVVPPPGGRRPLRQIMRGEPPAAAGEGRQMRRIERAEAAQAAATPAAGAPDPQMVGSWVRADSVGILDGFDLLADGTAKLHMRGGREVAGQWSSDPQESRVQFQGPEGQANITLVIWTGGPGLRGALITPSGRGRTLAFQRGGDGPSRQPAIRQP